MTMEWIPFWGSDLKNWVGIPVKVIKKAKIRLVKTRVTPMLVGVKRRINCEARMVIPKSI